MPTSDGATLARLFWTDDPRTGERAARDAAALTLPDGRADGPGVLSAPAWHGLAVPTTLAVAPERDMRLGILLTPLPYLPQGVWPRQPGEPLETWGCRMTRTLMAVGMIGQDDDGGWRMTCPVDEVVLDGVMDRAPEWLAGEEENAGLDKVADMVSEAFGKVWPDGYDARLMMRWAAAVDPVCRSGSLVATITHAIRLLDDGDEEGSKAIVSRIPAAWPGVLEEIGHTPDALRDWAGARRDWVDGMLDMLIEQELEWQDARAYWAGMRI